MANECLRQTHLTRVWLCRFGRKPLFILCGITMAIMQAATCALTKVTFTGDNIPHTAGNVMIGFICVFVACFAASWGPLGWLVSSQPPPFQLFSLH